MHPNLNDHVPFIATCWIQRKPPYLTSFVNVYSQTNLHNLSLATFRYFLYRAHVEDFILETVRVRYSNLCRLEYSRLHKVIFLAHWKMTDWGDTAMQHKIISPHWTPEVRGWIVVPLRAAADPRYSTNVSLIPRTAAASLACYLSQSCKSLQAASASVWCVCVLTEAPAVSSFQLIHKSLG